MDSIEQYKTLERRCLQRINKRAALIQAQQPMLTLDICRAKACEVMHSETADYMEARRTLSALGVRPLMFTDVGTGDGDEK